MNLFPPKLQTRTTLATLHCTLRRLRTPSSACTRICPRQYVLEVSFSTTVKISLLSLLA